MLAPILAVSLLLHLAIIVAMLPSRHEETVAPLEIPVEVVQIPAPPPKQQAGGEKREQAKSGQDTKQEQPKPEQASQQQPKQQQAKREQPQQAQPKPPQHPLQQQPQQQPTPRPTNVADRMDRLIGPMPALAMPASAETGTDLVSYRELVLSQVAKAKKMGKSFGIPGTASVSFTLDDHGGLVRCELVRKSVDPKLDTEAVSMVRRAAPYPAPPAGADRTFVIALRFTEAP